MALVMYCRIQNDDDENVQDELLTLLKSTTDDVGFYERIPERGVIYAAAFDWQALIGIAASSLAIAQALWAAYKKLAKNGKISDSEKSDLFVSITNTKDEAFSFNLDQQFKDENDFVVEFSETIEHMRKIRMVKKPNELKKRTKFLATTKNCRS